MPTSATVQLDAPVEGLSNVRRKALIQVLGAITYGELKAHDGAKLQADEADNDEDRRIFRKIAAEELRHHKGFSRRLTALGADVDRAMRPFEASLDTFHGSGSEDPVVQGVAGYLGEGIAADLLTWLKNVVDPDTSAFIDTVIEDEEEHEALAAARIRELIESEPGARKRAQAGVRSMYLRMAGSGSSGGGPGRFGAFLRLGRPGRLVTALAAGQANRLRTIGLLPAPAVLAGDAIRSVAKPASRAFYAATSVIPGPFSNLARRVFPT